MNRFSILIPMEFKSGNGTKSKPIDDLDPRSPIRKLHREPTEEFLKVYCRVRPLQENEQPHKGISIVEGQNTMLINNEESNRPIKSYNFTQIFKDQPQHVVVSKICDSSVVHSGKGGLIFAYGVTNSGKTHTILGTKEEPGILQYLFSRLAKPFELSAVEVYNQEFFLLTSPRRKLHLIQSSGTLEFRDFQPISVNQKNIEATLEEIIANRSQKTNGLNSKSSRSHAIFRIKAQGRVIGVVDLAGSQKSREGCSIEETTKINRSLLSLGRCLKCLQQQKNYKNMLIPFRESKLTMALAEYFNSDYNLVMVVNISLAKSLFSQTVNILEYAAVSRYIKPTNGKFGSSLKKMPSYTKQQPDEDQKIKGLQECIMNINLQELRKTYYQKYEAVSQVFDFMYQTQMEAQRKVTQQKLAKLRKEVDGQKSKRLYTSTCVGTSPKSCQATGTNTEVPKPYTSICVGTSPQSPKSCQAESSSFISTISAPFKYIQQTVQNVVRSLSPSKPTTKPESKERTPMKDRLRRNKKH